MEEELRKTFQAEVSLIAGSGGVFEVEADGRKVFSKAQTGRFPEQGEIVSALRNL